MPKTIFDELQRTKLEAEIITFLEETANRLVIPNKADAEELSKRQTQLQNYLKNNISARLKRAINKSLAGINEELNEEVDMDYSTTPPEYLIQTPSTEDLTHMNAMPAGADEDQRQRLTHMSKLVLSHESLPVVSTEEMKLNKIWHQLFKTVDQGKKADAAALLKQMVPKDSLLQLILRVHPLEYLQELLSHCIDAQTEGLKVLENDIIITQKTFELLIKDLATTLQHQTALYFSFGLPSHHAYSTEGRGFCIFNKTAILMRHAELTHAAPLNYVIIGTDVNRDNGLCQVLRDSASHLHTTHIDVFDSRVYPYDTLVEIDKEFLEKPKEIAKGVIGWQHNHYHYLAVDLASQVRSRGSIHPALVFALEQIQEQIKLAKNTKQQVMLLLPTGWDSHENETAFCGTFIRDHLMTKAEAEKHRFNNRDLVYFYKQVLQLYKENKESISGIYWGLEGGYNRAMYEQQIKLMLTTVSTQLEHEQASTFAPK